MASLASGGSTASQITLAPFWKKQCTCPMPTAKYTFRSSIIICRKWKKTCCSPCVMRPASFFAVNNFQLVFSAGKSREILTLPYLNCKVKSPDQIFWGSKSEHFGNQKKKKYSTLIDNPHCFCCLRIAHSFSEERARFDHKNHQNDSTGLQSAQLYLSQH